MRILTLLLLSVFLVSANGASADMKSKKKTEAKKKIKLTNTYWRLSEMNGKPVSATDENNAPYIYMQEKGDKLIGHTGCNNITGEFEDGSHSYVGFAPGYTEMACTDVETEPYIMNALKRANRYVINGEHLLLYDNTLVLAVFEAK
jgi:heat shock protein HslJ